MWFTIFELPAVARHLSRPARLGGGWMDSLRQALPGDGSLELGVAALGQVPFEPFDDDGTRYFHLQGPPATSGLRAVAQQWKHEVDDVSALAQARAVVESFQPDLIHVHGTEGPMGLLASLVKPPVLVSLQGILMECERFFFAGLPASEVVRNAASVGFFKGRGMIHMRWEMRARARRELQILKTARHFAGRTDWDRAIVQVANPTARYYWAGEVLRPEFYAGRWAPRPDAETLDTERPFRVYSTGGPAPYKGIVNLLEAFALLRGCSRRPVELRVSGELMSTGMRPIIERTMRRSGLDGAVTWLGPLPPEGLVAELQAADLFAYASLAENSPNALAEAQVVGAPCVAAGVGGVPSMITPGVDGLLCAPNDIWDLAGKMAAVEADPELARRLAEGARETGRRRHDPAAIAAGTMQMYADVIERHTAGRH